MAVADALEWCIHCRGMEFIFHYLDDLLVMGPPGSGVYKHSLELLVAECHELGVHLAAVKLEEPGSVIRILKLTLGLASSTLLQISFRTCHK